MMRIGEPKRCRTRQETSLGTAAPGALEPRSRTRRRRRARGL